MKLKEIGEFGLIERIREIFGRGEGVLAGLGEDVAVIEGGEGCLLLTTDLLTEGVHFRSHLISPFQLGWKALVVNLSDIAACGGTPRYFLVSLMVEPEREWEFVREIYEGIKAAGDRYGATLVGGDTSRGEALTLSIALLGEGIRDEVILRKGARPGDQIYVSGTLGDAALGLRLLLQGKKKGYLIERHLSPTPRLTLGRELARRHLATAAIDISDGLVQDLSHILKESRVGAKLHLERVPISDECREEAEALGLDPLRLALSGGEDYELLFTVAPGDESQLEEVAGLCRVPITRVGEVTSERELRLFKDGKGISLEISGYDHLKGS